MAPATSSLLDSLAALLASASEASNLTTSSCSNLTVSLKSLTTLTSPVSTSAADLIQASSNLTTVIAGLAQVQKTLTLPQTSPTPLLNILQAAPVSNLAFPDPTSPPLYKAFYSNPDPTYQPLSWKNKTLPPGLIADSHSAFTSLCQTLSHTNKHSGGQYATYLAAKQLQETGIQVRQEWLRAFEGLTRTWAGEFSGMKGDEASLADEADRVDEADPGPFSPPAPFSSPAPFSPQETLQDSSSPRRSLPPRRSVSFSPPPKVQQRHKFLPKLTVTSLRRLFTLLTTSTSSLYYSPKTFLTSSVYATPPSNSPQITISYITLTLSPNLPLPAYLQSALDICAKINAYPDDVLYSYAPTNLPYIDAYVHTRLLVITESLLSHSSPSSFSSAPKLSRRSTSEINPLDQTVDQSYEVCDAITTLSDILTVEREGYMELVSESLAKLRSHTASTTSAEFCAVYEQSVNSGFEIIAGYIIALFRLMTMNITSPPLPPTPDVRDITVATTNSLRVLSSYYASLSHLSSLAESIHHHSAATTTLSQTLLRNLTSDLTLSATTLISDLNRHLHSTPTPLAANLGVSAITSSAVYSIRVISSFKSVYAEMQEHCRKCETEGMDGVVRSIVVALMDNIQRQGQHIQETFGHQQSAGPLTPSRRTSIDLSGAANESFSPVSAHPAVTNTISSAAYKAIFLINNCYYLRHALSPDAATLRRQSRAYVDDYGKDDDDDHEPDHEIESSWFSDMLMSMTTKSEEVLIMETFGALAAHLADVDTSNFKYQNAKTKLLTLDSGRLLKSKFGGFNDTLTAMHGTMSTVALPESARHMVLSEGKDMVRERYKSFFETYSVYNFSKKKQDEYLRYPPILADSIYDELFAG